MPTLNTRNLMIGLGALLILVALLTDVFGLGQSARFGWKQGIVLSVGFTLVVAGALWGRVMR